MLKSFLYQVDSCENEIRQVALWISRVLKNAEDEAVREEVRKEVRALTVQFPLPNEK